MSDAFNNNDSFTDNGRLPESLDDSTCVLSENQSSLPVEKTVDVVNAETENATDGQVDVPNLLSHFTVDVDTAEPQPDEPPAETMQRSVLSISGLNKLFGKKHVVTDVSFSMQQGEVVGLLGPNGAGKTTTFYMIVGFHKPNAGDVFLDQLNITKLPMYKRAQLGISYLPQEASIFRKLTVEENIYAVLETRGELTTAQRKERLEYLLNEFGITEKRKQKAYSLSGGERRRTEIARALAIEPKFLLLDEPFAGIDPIAIHDIKEVILHLSERGIGVLITDHNVRDTLEITDNAYIINAGVIVESGDREKILNSEIARRIYLGETFRM